MSLTLALSEREQNLLTHANRSKLISNLVVYGWVKYGYATRKIAETVNRWRVTYAYADRTKNGHLG